MRTKDAIVLGGRRSARRKEKLEKKGKGVNLPVNMIRKRKWRKGGGVEERKRFEAASWGRIPSRVLQKKKATEAISY